MIPLSTTEDAYEHWRAAAKAIYGWIPIPVEPGAAYCPLILLKSRCPMIDGEPCFLCQNTNRLRVWDHVGLWYDAHDHQMFLTSEPYQVSGADLVLFIATMNGLGLNVDVTGRGLWHNTTLLLILSAKHD